MEALLECDPASIGALLFGLTNGGPAGSTHTLASDYYIQTWAYGRYGYGTALALVLTLLVTVVGILEVLAGRKKEDSIS